MSKWQEAYLGEVINFYSGGTPSKARSDYWGGGIPWVSAKDMKSFFLEDSEDHITEVGLANGTKLAPAGSVLLLTRGMTLLNNVPICVLQRPMAFNQDIKAVRPKAGICQEFVPYLLLGNKENLLNLVDLAGHGTGRLNSNDLKTLSILLPPLPEQKAIARILSALDDKIELNRRMNETLEAMARAIFKDWFVDFGPTRAKQEGRAAYLPEHLWSLFPGAIDGDTGLPQGWQQKALDEVANFLNGLALQKYSPLKNEEPLPVIKIAELRSGITEKSGRASRKIPEKYIVQDGDFLFSWSGSLVAKFWTEGEGALNQHLFKVTSADYPVWFFTQWTYHHLEDFQRIAAAKATTMGHIQRGHLTAAKVICPKLNLMNSMSDFMTPLVEKTIENSLESRTLADLRDRLLPKLMSGEIRVKEAEKMVEEVL